ncbi:hypothetical protein [Mucilaginibacter sp. UYCu711]|uniref:hypothetical protein n=1 Tax=Mucilaginibacter sp. UYCu711 TaxID=3156339 RepID=UPI003D1B8513
MATFTNEADREDSDLLELKLELLHNCLTLKEAQKQTLSAKLAANKIYADAFEKFQNEPLDDQTHSNKLSILRDTLLSDY